MSFEFSSERKQTTSVAVRKKKNQRKMHAFVSCPPISKSENGSTFRSWLFW